MSVAGSILAAVSFIVSVVGVVYGVPRPAVTVVERVLGGADQALAACNTGHCLAVYAPINVEQALFDTNRARKASGHAKDLWSRSI